MQLIYKYDHYLMQDHVQFHTALPRQKALNPDFDKSYGHVLRFGINEIIWCI